MKRKPCGLSLFELIAALVIFHLVAMALYAIASFSYSNINVANRRAFIQQEASFIVDHLSKNFSGVIGGNGEGTIQNTTGAWIKGRYDRNNNGQPDAWPNDRYFGYEYISGTYELRYYDNTNDNPNNIGGGREVLSRKVTNFICNIVPYNNYMYISVTTRYKPALVGSSSNPEVTIYAYVNMPMMSSGQ